MKNRTISIEKVGNKLLLTIKETSSDGYLVTKEKELPDLSRLLDELKKIIE